MQAPTETYEEKHQVDRVNESNAAASVGPAGGRAVWDVDPEYVTTQPNSHNARRKLNVVGKKLFQFD